jgi:antibiotic biosynthesis monooxygenase (ABM) superfamily enzyme
MVAEAGPGSGPDMVTAVILHQVGIAMRPRYEQWLDRIIPVAATFPGHRGVDVLRPTEGSQTYTVAVRFDDLAGAQAWLASRAHQMLVVEVEPLLVASGKLNAVTGLEFWFEPPCNRRVPRRFKQFLLTLSVFQVLTMLVTPVVHALFGAVPPLLPHWIEPLAVTSIIVAAMTYVVMPTCARMSGTWLYR